MCKSFTSLVKFICRCFILHNATVFFLNICIYLFDCTGSQLWHMGPLTFVAESLDMWNVECGIFRYSMQDL